MALCLKDSAVLLLPGRAEVNYLGLDVFSLAPPRGRRQWRQWRLTGGGRTHVSWRRRPGHCGERRNKSDSFHHRFIYFCAMFTLMLPRDSAHLGLSPWWLAAVCTDPLPHSSPIVVDFGLVSVHSCSLSVCLLKVGQAGRTQRCRSSNTSGCDFFSKAEKSRRLIVGH